MSLGNLTIICALLLLIYWSSYFWSRIGMFESRKFSMVVFVFNIFLLVLITLLFIVVFEYYSLLNKTTFLTIAIMGAGLLMHHATILLNKLGIKNETVEEIHGPISHDVSFVLLSFNILYFGSAVISSIHSGYEKISLILLMVITIAMSIIGIFKRTRAKFFSLLK
jgi:hypothetical protein